MASPLLSTKLSIPPLRAGLVERTRLLQKLEQGVHCGFVLVSAPAGYGKSTLVRTWMAQTQAACCWLSLDEGDNDLQRFLSYLAAALRQMEPDAWPGLEGALHSSEPPAVEILLTPLINQLMGRCSPFWLVLDDYHAVQNPQVHQVVRFLLENRPPSLRILISTRADPPFALSRLRAGRQMVELRLADLRFTREEASQYLYQATGFDLSPDDLAQLDASIEGWVAGYQMAGLSLQGRQDASRYIHSFSGEHRFILDYLFEEVLQRQPPDVQEFLLHSAALERLSGALCDAILQRTGSQAQLESLSRSNLFLIELDERREWFRYHHLFRDLLRAKLAQTHPQQAAYLQQQAAFWFAANQDMENAIQYALLARDYEQAASWIEALMERLDRQNQQRQLSDWVSRLPQPVLEHHPWLCVQRAWGDYWSGRRGDEEHWLHLVEAYLERASEPEAGWQDSLRGHIAAVRAHLALASEDLLLTREMAYEALAALGEDDPMRCETAIALGAAFWGSGDAQRAEQSFRIALSPALQARYPSMVVGPACYAGLQQAKQGQLQQALATFEQALRLATLPNGRQMPIAGFPLINIGDVWRERNDLERAELALRTGLELCMEFGQPDILCEAQVWMARLRLAQGDLDAANHSLDQAERVLWQAKVDPFVRTWLDECRLKIWLAQGDLQAVTRWAQASGQGSQDPLNFLHDLAQQNLARALVAQVVAGARSAQPEAQTLLARLLLAAQQAGWVQDQIKFLTLQAVLASACGAPAEAQGSLQQALILAEPGGYVRLFVDEGPVLRELLLALKGGLKAARGQALAAPDPQAALETAYRLEGTIDSMLAAFDGRPPAQTVQAPAQAQSVMVEPLSGREIEVLELLAKGCADKDIAASLVIARGTVHKHLKNIYEKLDVHNRTSAVQRARELGLL